MELLAKTARVTKTPSDGGGMFDFTVDAFDTVDSDKEKIGNYKNVDAGDMTTIPMDYAHLAILGDGADGLAADIGSAMVTRIGNKLAGHAQLDLTTASP
jgi:hypothetical protein